MNLHCKIKKEQNTDIFEVIRTEGENNHHFQVSFDSLMQKNSHTDYVRMLAAIAWSMTIESKEKNVTNSNIEAMWLLQDAIKLIGNNLGNVKKIQ